MSRPAMMYSLPSATSGAGSAEYSLPSARMGLPGACSRVPYGGCMAQAGTLASNNPQANTGNRENVRIMALPP
ncbi:putative xylosidase domain protein [Xanthomonas citri pv. punicae str. LMG 859]|nr:putative xylosidase domain protein [Xanthomonas citri pv. punicae str. LMG 859]